MNEIITLSIGIPKSYSWKGKNERSAIGKHLVDEAYLLKDGFLGDAVDDLVHHGGRDRAVCFYPYENYAIWEKEFGKTFSPPSFGENICSKGMLEKDTYIGDVFQVGDAIIQVSQGRVPCSKISKFNDTPLLLAKIVETGLSGYFFRVIQEGEINQNSTLSLIDRTQERISVLRANQVMFHERKNKSAIEEIIEVKELATEWRETLALLLVK